MDVLTSPSFATLLALLQFRASHQSGYADLPAFSHMDDGEEVSATLTFGELAQRARAIAAGLQAHCAAGDRVLLVYPPCIDYIVGFFACAYAGVIAVPALPPANARTLPRLQLIARDAAPALALTDAAIALRMKTLQADSEDALATLPWFSHEHFAGMAEQWREPAAHPSDIAFLQYTSGSTGAPKGVMVSNANILANTHFIQSSFPVGERVVVVSWLPPHHDMGLIGKILFCVYAGHHCVQFAPSAFVMRPVRWLKAVSDFGASITGAPNFAFESCLEKITDEQKQGLRLDSLKFVWNGAEPIRPATLRRFAAAFSECGLNPAALTPVYGLAEATLLVSGAVAGVRAFPSTLTLDKADLAANAVTAIDAGADGIEFVALGLARSGGHQCVIVEPDTLRRAGADAVGEIWVSGPSIARGYWMRPQESAHTFCCIPGEGATPYLRTGDLGFIRDGQLFVAGRIKDTMIFNGRNLYPKDIEATVEQVDAAFRINGCAVFSIEGAHGTRLVIVQEVESRKQAQVDTLLARLRIELAEQCELFDIAAVLLIKPGRIPRTSSGKIQHARCRAMYLAAQFEPIWWWDGTREQEVARLAQRPLSEMEATLTAIWSTLLKRAQIGLGEDFFAAGAHSLLATQALSQIRARMQVDLPLRALFEAPTIASLARRVMLAGQGRDSLPALVAIDRSGPLPLSFAQQRLWFLDQLEGGADAYTLAGTVQLQGQLDTASFARAFDEVVRRHEALRTHFVSVNGEPAQVVAAHRQCDLGRIDLSGLDAALRDEHVCSQLREAVQTPFNLAQGPLLRASLVTQAPDEHTLVLSMHHIISDGWSIGVLMRELGTLYAAFVQNRPSPLSELAIQYADFAHWQRQSMQGELRQTQVAYWREQLAGAPALLSLPIDRARPALQSYHGAVAHFNVAPGLTGALHELGRTHNATLFMTLCAAFNVLLSRYSGQGDICIGTPIANRKRAETEALIGFFVNTLVMRSQVDGTAPFGRLLEQVRATALDAYAHQDVPFEQVVEALNPARALSQTPLFQVMLVLQNTPQARVEGLTMRLQPADATVTQFDLTLSVTEDAGQLGCFFEYNTDLFDAATISRMVGHFTRLLGAIVADPAARIDDLPMLDAAERAQLLTSFNATAAPYPQGETVSQLFEAQVRRTPDAIALVFEDAQLSYAQLNERANMLAHRLRALGVGPDVLVGLGVARSLEMVVGLLAVLKAGGAYLPLDPDSPSERLAYMLDDARPAALLTQRRFAPTFATARIPVFCLDSDWPQLDVSSTADLPCTAAPGNLAYVIYTSGSTGKPKGVQALHQGVVNVATSHINAICRRFNLRQARTSLNAPFVFDASVSELAMLLDGHTLYIVGEALRQSPADLAQFLARHRLEVFDTSPLQLKYLIEQGASAYLPRVILFGGEAIDGALWQQLQAMQGTHFINAYGPTETTVDVTFAFVDQAPARPVIGRPQANTQVYLLDAALNPVALGVAGQLYVAGAGLARGYLGQSAMTAERFIPNPFGPSGERMYATGDLARYLVDGNIEYLGRIDDQVKLRGFRIELGEVEAALKSLAGVREACVLVHRHSTGSEALVAYLAAFDGIDTRALRETLARTLPHYMVPSQFIVLEQLPLTPIGKVDRHALPPPTPADNVAYVGASTDEETRLAAIWAAVLQCERVGIHDDFFSLGGHSLLATQVVSRMRTEFAVDLPLRVLFEAPTIARLTLQLAQLRQTPGPVAPAPITPVRRDGPLPLSFGQQRLWFLDQYEQGSTAYNMSGALRLSGQLDVAALGKALNEVLRRHESLRTTFASVDGQANQVIAAQCDLALALTDLSALPHGEREANARWKMQDAAQTPFDLAHGPLLRASLIVLGAQDHLLMLCMHHIVSDGWSIGVLVREIGALYAAFVQDLPSPLPDLAIQYADFAHWQRQYLQGQFLQTQLGYWSVQLADAPALLTLPTDRARPALQTYRGAVTHFGVATDLAHALHALGKTHNATLFMTLCAAFNVLLSRHSGQDDICIGTPIANRNRAETEALIGFFVNTLVLRARVDGTAPFAKLLEQVRDTALDAYAHQDVPFEQLVDLIQPQRQVSHAPLFQAMLVLLNTPADRLELPGLCLRVESGDSTIAHFDLTLNVTEEEGHLSCFFEYNTDLFDAGTIERMAGHFTRLLGAIAADPAARIDDLPMLDAAERAQLLASFNATAAPYPHGETMSQLFEAQVRRTPDAIALVFEDAQLSYAQLNERANMLAHRLRALGVGPDVLAGLCVARSLEMAVGLLAVLKAGGAYLPLDPDSPPERLSYMLDDARPAVLLTQQRFAPTFVTAHIPVFCLDSDWSQLDVCATADLPCTAAPGNLAYVIYTSGSTGKPKGVLTLHQGVVNVATSHINAICRRFNLRQARTSLNAPFVFDASVSELAMLLDGHTLYIVGEALRQSPADLAQFLARHRLEVFDTSPLQLKYLIEQGASAYLPRVILFGGEAIDGALWQQLQAMQGTHFINAYGPTETTVDVTFAFVDQAPARPVIGRPQANTQVYLLDAALNPVALGVAGQLFVAGAGLARGYLGQSAMTAERFIPNPFGPAGERMYATGDLARYLADGNIEYLGRIDSQLKIRGFRIELGEIEAALAALPGVRDALVLAREDAAGAKRLLAYIVPQQDHARAFDQDAMRMALARAVPEYMVPAHFVVLDALPLTATGKVDTKALPLPDMQRSDVHYVAPQAGVEQTLAAIWAEVLGIGRVGGMDNFFHLGGDSILSIQIIARARQAGLYLTPKQLFQYPTVSALAAVVQADSVVLAEQGRVDGDVALTPIQHWFFEQNFASGQHYNQSLLLRLVDGFDVTKLEQVLDAVLAHHDALHLRYEQGAGVWRQTHGTRPARGGVLERVDLTSTPEHARMQAVSLHCAALQAGLDLGAGPLLRVACFDAQEGPAYLFLVCHHLVIDGLSWRILLEDLQSAYSQAARGVALSLPAKTSSFKDWSHRLQAYSGDAALRIELDYWRHQHDTLSQSMPLDFPQGANRSESTRVVTVMLEQADTDALLTRVPAAYHTQINDVLLTALAFAFHAWTGATNLSIELEGHGREDLFEELDVSRTVGWFTSLYPVRLELGGSREYGTALKGIKEQLRAIPNRGIGYGVLRYLAADRPLAPRSRHCAMSFNYLGQTDQMLDAAGLFALAEQPEDADHGGANLRSHEIDIDARIDNACLSVAIRYSSGRFRDATIAAFASQYLQHLRELIAHCAGPLDGASVHTPSDFALAGLDQDELNDLLDGLDLSGV
ncbi:MAG: amino acid adenylation domain-containing protein [Pseudomonadota bacterium]